MHKSQSQRWIALIILCLGSLMIVLDTTIVNIALPSIAADLHFSAVALAWVVNAYLLTFGGLLILAGRLGDMFGYRRLFIIGVAVFTLASFTAGIASMQTVLLLARALQGISGAAVTAVTLSLLMQLFTEQHERTKAMGIFGFVSAAGGSVGVFLGGVVTSVLSWHWVFLINIPIGIIVAVLAYRYVPITPSPAQSQRLDGVGSVLITAGLMCAVYGIVNGNDIGWLSVQSIAVFGVAVAMLVAFAFWENRIAYPLIPFSLFRSRIVLVSNSIGVLWAASGFAWFFLAALYLQVVLHYTPMQIGLSFLPGNIIMAACSVSVSAKIVNRFGTKKPLVCGVALITLALFLFSFAPVNGTFWLNVLPGMVIMGLGSGIAFNPLLLSAMSDVPSDQAGLASGVINTSFMMGGALGLAVLASIAQAVTAGQLTHGIGNAEAFARGYHIAFLVGACASGVGMMLAMRYMRNVQAGDNVSHVH